MNLSAALSAALGAQLGSAVAGGRPLAPADGPEPPDAPGFFALEWIEEGRLDGAGEQALGHGLAALHAAAAPHFGGPEPLRIGPIELPNGPTDSWPELYADHRLRPLARRATEQGALPDGTEAFGGGYGASAAAAAASALGERPR